MKRPSSIQTIITTSVLYVEMRQRQGVKPSQNDVRKYLKETYHQNPLMFGTATWLSVAGTFRSMLSKVKKNTDSSKGLEKYLNVKKKNGVNVLSLKKQTSKFR